MNDLSKVSRRKKYLRWGGFVLAVILLVYLLSRQGWGEILAAVRQIPLWRLGCALVLTLISRLAVAGRWHALMKATKMDISYSQTARLTFAGLFASNFLPTTVGGDVVRLAGTVQLGLDGAISAASLIVDRLVGLFGMLLAVPLGARPLWAWLITEQGWRDSFATQAMILAQVGDGKLWSKVRGLFDKIINAFSLWKEHPRSLLMSLAMTWVHMLCLFGMIALLLNGLGESISIWLIGGLWSFVYLITLVPISINGYGVQEVAMTLIFTNVGGITMKSGLTLALLVRTLQMLASLPGAASLPSILAGLQKSNSDC
ncbi:MAG: lysylphosphatidylglycerol synthase transmembrane domain-containing protein [Chloroflexota bacterium]|nr:lysylphosphatidylglycerol synthase transmembrane domain-containing protein [Chloroflexota bacterium]